VYPRDESKMLVSSHTGHLAREKSSTFFRIQNEMDTPRTWTVLILRNSKTPSSITIPSVKRCRIVFSMRRRNSSRLDTQPIYAVPSTSTHRYPKLIFVVLTYLHRLDALLASPRQTCLEMKDGIMNCSQSPDTLKQAFRTIVERGGEELGCKKNILF
jgi:hypothetical protein